MNEITLGDVSVTRVEEMHGPVGMTPEQFFPGWSGEDWRENRDWLVPDHLDAESDIVQVAMQTWALRSEGRTILVDTGIGNDKPRPAVAAWDHLSLGYLDNLAKAGIQPEDVDLVVNTHLHVDHVGWNTMLEDGKWVPTFPKARYLMGRTELEHWRANDEGETGEILADSVQPILDAGLAELVDMDHVLSPEVRLIPTPGHTPGHVSVMIESEGQTAVITGDMTHHPCQMAHPDWSPPFDTDRKASALMRRKMFAQWADQPILVIGTHYAGPTAGHVKTDGEAFRFDA